MKGIKLLCTLTGLFIAGISMSRSENIVFSADFDQQKSIEGWVINDTNADGISWKEDSNLNGIVYNGIKSDTEANDWLFTPQFSLESGKHYILSYTIAQRGAFGADNVTIAIGNSTTPDAMKTLIKEVYDMQSGMTTRYCHLCVTESENLHIGLHLVSPQDNGIVSLKKISIEETAEQMPLQAPAMIASIDSKSQGVNMKWVNPKRDTMNAAITSQLDARIYEDDILVATLENVTPGDTIEYVYNPTSFTGKHTIALAMAIGNGESERISKLLDYDDIKGSLVPEYTFPLKSKTDFSQWVVENLDNDNYKWGYYAGAADFSAMGKNVNDWVISTGYEFQAGKRYVLTYNIASSRDYPATFDITIGNAQASSAQNTIIASYTDLCQNGYALYESPQFVVETDGTYYIGIHAKYVGNALYIKEITVNTIEAGGETEEEELFYEEQPETIFPDNKNGDLTIKMPYHQRLASEGVELYGAFTNALIDQYTSAPNGIYHIVPTANEYKADLHNPDLMINLSGGCTYHNGKLYCNEYNASGNYQEEFPVWKVLDAQTYEVLSETRLNDNCENTTISLAYDATCDKIYGFVRDYVDSWFVEVNPENGEMRRIGDRLDYRKRFLAIGCNIEGDLYCIYLTEDYYDGEQIHYLARINKENGAISPIGEITALNMMPEDLLINMKLRQSIFFNNSTGKMYWLFCSSSIAIDSEYAAIFEVNPINANAVLQTWLTDVLAISGAYFAEPNIDAPHIVTNISYTPDAQGSLNGNLHFNLPQTTYGGNTLSGKVGYKVIDLTNSNEITSGEAAAGEAIDYNMNAAEGIHTISIQAYNDKGYGPIVKHTFLVGYDLPAAPENVVLVDNGLTTTLTWEAPYLGINGAVYDKSKLTYDIVRYPDEEVVATGITENSFVETHSGTMSRYMYAVYSCSDGERIQGVLSNAIVLGDPLNVPYGGVFADWTEMYNYYTILDENKDNYTWTYDESTGAAFYPYNYQLQADDWMISPPINYYIGDVYTLRFSAFSTSSEYLESLNVYLGTGKTPELLSEKLFEQPELPAIEDDGTVSIYEIDFMVPQSGVYYYGFKAYSPAFQEYLYLYNVSVTRKVNGSVEGVKEYNRNFDAFAYNKGISIINPHALDISIYTINGMLVERTSQQESHIKVQPGVYIVRSEQSVVKVVVR